MERVTQDGLLHAMMTRGKQVRFLPAALSCHPLTEKAMKPEQLALLIKTLLENSSSADSSQRFICGQSKQVLAVMIEGEKFKVEVTRPWKRLKEEAPNGSN